MMRICALGLAVLAVCVGACSEYARGVCCTTEADCNNLGLSEMLACPLGEACAETRCVAAQCASSLDCTEENPVCAAGLCLRACAADTDCLLTDGKPYCAGGQCVGCMESSQCGGAQPFCDAATSQCRGCTQDAECGAGVCRSAEATCVAAEDVIFVTENGNDTGTCTNFSPCRSFAAALSHVTPQRNTIRILGAAFTTGAAAVRIAVPVYIKGDGTRVTGPTAGADFTFEVSAATRVAFERVDIRHPLAQGLEVDGGSQVSMSAATVEGVYVLGGSVFAASDVEFVNNDGDFSIAVTCRNSSLDISGSRVDGGDLRATDCMMDLSSSRFENRASLLISRGISSVENNVLIADLPGTPLMTVDQPAAGTRIYHNTLVDVVGASQQSALFFRCLGDADVSSNIFAGRTRDPFLAGTSRRCAIRYSLFDDLIDPALAEGAANRIVPLATMFANLANQRFEPAAASPARGAGEDLGVSSDFEGQPRPMPTGSSPDVGAYEVP